MRRQLLPAILLASVLLMPSATAQALKGSAEMSSTRRLPRPSVPAVLPSLAATSKVGRQGAGADRVGSLEEGRLTRGLLASCSNLAAPRVQSLASLPADSRQAANGIQGGYFLPGGALPYGAGMGTAAWTGPGSGAWAVNNGSAPNVSYVTSSTPPMSPAMMLAAVPNQNLSAVERYYASLVPAPPPPTPQWNCAGLGYEDFIINHYLPQFPSGAHWL